MLAPTLPSEEPVLVVVSVRRVSQAMLVRKVPWAHKGRKALLDHKDLLALTQCAPPSSVNALRVYQAGTVCKALLAHKAQPAP